MEFVFIFYLGKTIYYLSLKSLNFINMKIQEIKNSERLKIFIIFSLCNICNMNNKQFSLRKKMFQKNKSVVFFRNSVGPKSIFTEE